MKTDSTQLEILLITNTTLLSRQRFEQVSPEVNTLSNREKLAAACWNGLVKELLPEIYSPHHTTKLFIWKIREAAASRYLEMSQSPLEMQRLFSVDPYYFLESYIVN